jgi:hypothetical protein
MPPDAPHQLYYMVQWGWDVCAEQPCEFHTIYNCVTCQKQFCVGHGQAHGEILLY